MAQTTGRPSRGNRTQFVIRVPEYLGEAIKAAAQAKQTSLTDYLGKALAEHLDLPVPPPAPHRLNLHPSSGVEELPLTA